MKYDRLIYYVVASALEQIDEWACHNHSDINRLLTDWLPSVALEVSARGSDILLRVCRPDGTQLYECSVRIDNEISKTRKNVLYALRALDKNVKYDR